MAATLSLSRLSWLRRAAPLAYRWAYPRLSCEATYTQLTVSSRKWPLAQAGSETHDVCLTIVDLDEIDDCTLCFAKDLLELTVLG